MAVKETDDGADSSQRKQMGIKECIQRETETDGETDRQ
jgi:hypothetical protein